MRGRKRIWWQRSYIRPAGSRLLGFQAADSLHPKIHSSGSTGFPKPIAVTHRQFMTSLANLSDQDSGTFCAVQAGAMFSTLPVRLPPFMWGEPQDQKELKSCLIYCSLQDVSCTRPLRLLDGFPPVGARLPLPSFGPTSHGQESRRPPLDA